MDRTVTAGTVAIAMLVAAGGASAAPVLRTQVTQHGDFVLMGNTLAHDCAPGGPAPVVGTVGACGSSTTDTAPDVFWRSDSPAAGGAEANNTITSAQSRSMAKLNLPPGADVTNAYLYWAARLTPGDATATVERPGVFSSDMTALQTAESTDFGAFYQSVADVTSLVQTYGSGDYRVSGVNSYDLVNLNQGVGAAGWWMVVFYRDPAQPARNLALFDGLDAVLDSAGVQSTISGFTVPVSGFSAKLGVVVYDGDNQSTGDALRWDANTLADALNPADNFFNGTRSLLGVAVSNAGDLPQLAGTAQSMSGMDLDVVQIPNSLLTGGQTSATVSAVSLMPDTYLLGGFITSISALLPDLSSSTKSVTDLNGNGVAPGDLLEYTITVANTGGDVATGVVLSDVLPAGVAYVPGSLQISAGPNMGLVTDAAGDDQGEYLAGASAIWVRLGDGATATQGGTLGVEASTTVRFRVTIDLNADGVISNQAMIHASGASGSAAQDYPTDGNGADPGAPPTQITVDSDVPGCQSDGDCGGPTSGMVCDDATHLCTDGCRGEDGNGCPEGQVCSTTDHAIGVCSQGAGGAGGGGVAPKPGDAPESSKTSFYACAVGLQPFRGSTMGLAMLCGAVALLLRLRPHPRSRRSGQRQGPSAPHDEAGGEVAVRPVHVRQEPKRRPAAR